MRKEKSAGVLLHVGGVGVQFDIGHAPGQLELTLAEVLRYDHHVGTHERRVADVAESLARQIGDQANDCRVFQVKVASEPACDVDVAQVFKPQPYLIEHQCHGGVDGGLGADDVLDVDLGNDQRLADGTLVGWREGIVGAASFHADGRAGAHAVELAGGVNPAREEQVGDQVDHAGTADAAGRDVPHGGVVGHARGRVNRGLLARNGGGAHPAFNTDR